MFKDRGLIIALFILGLGYLLYLIKGILLPFIVALIFAYILDPIVRKFEKLNFSRSVSTLLVVILFFITIGITSAMVFPIMYQHITMLVEFLSQYKKSLSEGMIPEIMRKAKGLSPDLINRLEQSLNNLSGHIVTFVMGVLKEIFHSSFVAINLLSLIFISPIVTFYVLRDWRKVPPTINKLVPRGLSNQYNEIIHQLDKTLSGYLRGQIYVCLILGAYYAISLSILGLKSGATLGALVGALIFIPYIGALFGATLAIIIATLQFQSLSYILAIVAIFIIGHLVESNFITPKLIGDKVGLHPVWIMFGLLAFGALFGFIGILSALPLTAMVGVIIKFLVAKYKKSAFYNNI